MPSQLNNLAKYEKVILYVKTKSFARDNRVKKEIDSLLEAKVAVDVVVFSNDETPPEYHGVGVKKFRGMKNSAPKSFFVRAVAALYFSGDSLMHARRLEKKDGRRTLHWVADPVLFPLVLGLRSFCRGGVLWDHHELPPEWIFRSRLIASLFIKAYESAEMVVHANKNRMLYLEERIKRRAKNAKIINNYPREIELLAEKKVDSLADVAAQGGFIFLQNSISDDRCGPSIFSAIRRCGLRAIHAGEASDQQLLELEKKVGPIRDFCVFAGSLDLLEINWLIKKSLCTIICYKQTSANQKYCEPNRLFHALGLGARVIVGNNPTMVDEVVSYPGAIVLADDGSAEDGIYFALKGIVAGDGLGMVSVRSEKKTWSKCEEVIFDILGK